MKVGIFSDFDGTVTTKDTLDTLADTRIGIDKRKAYDGMIIQKKIPLWNGLDRWLRECKIPLADALSFLKREISIDNTFPAFSHWCHAQEIPLTIVSAGLREVIQAYVGELPVSIRANAAVEGDGWFGLCPENPDCSTGVDKRGVLQEARDRGITTIYIGDGISDRQAVWAADRVYAKKGLADYCRKEKLAFIGYTTFADVQADLTEYLSGR